MMIGPFGSGGEIEPDPLQGARQGWLAAVVRAVPIIIQPSRINVVTAASPSTIFSLLGWNLQVRMELPHQLVNAA